MGKPACSNCPAPLAPGGAGGLCPRCYRYRNRTGRLPPAERLIAEPGTTESVRLSLPVGTRARLERLAARRGMSVGEMIAALVAAAP